MDSIEREVVTRSGVEPRVPESPTASLGMGAEDAELERILASLRTNIKIVGIGGGRRPHDRHLYLPLPRGGRYPCVERGVWAREAAQLCRHRRRDPDRQTA